MYKKIIFFMSLVMFIATFTGLVLAGPPPFTPWKCLVYDGIVWNDVQNQIVLEDTGVFVTNPNPNPIKAWIRIFNKYGEEIWSGYLFDGGEQIQTIPPMGFGWMPLGWALIQAGYQTNGREKVTFQISIDRPTIKPRLKCVVEIKQVIWSEPCNPLDMLGGSGPPIKEWCETAVEHWTKCPASSE